MSSHDPRIDLEHLPEETLFNIARNPAAVHRGLAMRLLVERASLFAGHPDIAEECRELVIQDPIVLKKVDPAQALHALRLPGVIDILADLQTRRIALTRTVAEQNTAHTKQIESLGSTVSNNKDAAELALRQAYSSLWKDATVKIFTLKTEHDEQIAALRADHEREIAAANVRLVLLERSPWKKFTDWVKARWSRLRKRQAVSAPSEQEDVAGFEARVAEMIRQA
jgi:hypothetical protein